MTHHIIYVNLETYNTNYLPTIKTYQKIDEVGFPIPNISKGISAYSQTHDEGSLSIPNVPKGKILPQPPWNLKIVIVRCFVFNELKLNDMLQFSKF